MGDYWNRSKKWRRRHDRLWRAEIRQMRERHFRKCLRMFGPTNPAGTERRHRLIREDAPGLLREARHALRDWIDRGAPREWTPTSWNTCPSCGDSVDADEVFAGSEVHCGCCNRWFVVTEFVGLDGSSVWGLQEIEDEDDADESAISPEALAMLRGGIESGKTEPVVYLGTFASDEPGGEL